MILKLTNSTNEYTFEVTDLNHGEKLFYNFQISTLDVEDGKYNMAITDDNDVVIAEEQVCIGYFNSETIQYQRAENVYINAPLEGTMQAEKNVEISEIETVIIPDDGFDAMEKVNVNAQPVYNNGYNDGETDQKAKLTNITITNNGTYTNEDGYGEVVVDVPDLNGDYNEGYDAGKIEGYDSGYTAGIKEGTANAGEIIAQTARVLDVTENGIYDTKYSEPRLLTPITGKYPNGDNFYDYAYINTHTGYNTGIFPGPTTRLEFWWRFDGTIEQGDGGEGLIIGSHNWGYTESVFKVGFEYGNKALVAAIGSTEPIKFEIPDKEWHHYTMSYKDGFFIDGKKISDFGEGNLTETSTSHPMCINYYYASNSRVNADYYGMVKIDDTIFIPTEEGFKNYTTNEFLPLVKQISYKYEYKKSDNINTGEYADGTLFYDYAEIKDYVYNTEILPNETTKLEFWFKRDDAKESWANVIAASEADKDSFRIRQNAIGGLDAYVAQLKNSTISFNMTSSIWYHIEMSYAGGLIVNGEKVGDFTENISQYTIAPIFINGGQLWNLPDGTDDGNFGMIKITKDGVTNVIIPTEDGLKNITTNKYLPIVNIPYVYTQVEPEYTTPTGNLIKTVNVNVPPIIDVAKYGIKLGYSAFIEVPDFYDFSNVTDFSNMFIYSGNLTKIPSKINGNIVTHWNKFIGNTNVTSIEPIDISLCKNLDGMFSDTKLTEIPYLNTSNAITMRNFLGNNTTISTIPELNTRRVEKMSNFFNNYGGNKNLVSLPKIYCDSCDDMGYYFSYYADGMSNLTEVGGWINLKCNWNDRYGLPSCNNLTYQSCINILNGLYDFTGNGETPTSSQGQLKVHPNFLTTVGDEISIGTDKGWTITA